MNAKENVIVYFAITKRNEKTFEFFKNECIKHKIECKDITDNVKTVSLFKYSKENVRLYNLTINKS